jgi:hypothetical protein
MFMLVSCTINIVAFRLDPLGLLIKDSSKALLLPSTPAMKLIQLQLTRLDILPTLMPKLVVTMSLLFQEITRVRIRLL